MGQGVGWSVPWVKEWAGHSYTKQMGEADYVDRAGKVREREILSDALKTEP